MKESTAKPSSGQGRSSEVARALIRRTKQASRRRFPAEEKIRILLEGVRAEISVAEFCRREGIHPPVYYTQLKDFLEAGDARRPGRGRGWNRLGPGEGAGIRAERLRGADRSRREWACWLTDHAGLAGSGPPVYRLLKRHGLIRPAAVLGFPAGPEYRVKPTRPN